MSRDHAGEARRFRTDLARIDLPATGAVRAPGEAIGTFAVECAMDELAEELGLDPIELRRRNEPARDPTTGKRFSTRRLLDCYEEGARRFGWDERNPAPRSRSQGSSSEGEWLVGFGVGPAAKPVKIVYDAITDGVYSTISHTMTTAAPIAGSPQTMARETKAAVAMSRSLA